MSVLWTGKPCVTRIVPRLGGGFVATIERLIMADTADEAFNAAQVICAEPVAAPKKETFLIFDNLRSRP